MKCFYHNDKDATVICKGCSRAICSDCTISDSGEMYCPNCFSFGIDYQKKYLSKLKIRYIVGGVLAVFFGFAFMSESFGAGLVAGILMGTFPIGLFSMKNSPNPYVPVTLDGFGKLLLIKWGIAFIFGPIFAIISIFTYMNTLNSIKANENLLEEAMRRQVATN